jgi:two-component system, NtrC family, response regulator HydG
MKTVEAQSEIHPPRAEAHIPSFLQMGNFLDVAVSHDLPVLLTGETGTGKTFLARWIHERSSRCDHPVMVVACGALVANLIESELFGHAKGAFTGADRHAEGKFAAVGQGTLLLDEIDTLGLPQQTNLLRIIETGEFEPVGSHQTQRCKARLIFASNVNLEQAVDDGRFRRDLFYRINVLSIFLPPLRERIDDILPLAAKAVARACARFHKEPMEVSAEAQAALEAYPWPGNIRQLENVIQNAVLFGTGSVLRLKHLPQSLQDHALRHSGGGRGTDSSLGLNREIHERSVIHKTLLDCDYNCSNAAKVLRVSRTTLYKKIKKYGLMEDEAVGSSTSNRGESRFEPVGVSQRGPM